MVVTYHYQTTTYIHYIVCADYKAIVFQHHSFRTIINLINLLNILYCITYNNYDIFIELEKNGNRFVLHDPQNGFGGKFNENC